MHFSIGLDHFYEKLIYILIIFRYMLDNIRNPAIMKAKLIQKLFMGLFIGTLFYGLETDQVSCLPGKVLSAKFKLLVIFCPRIFFHSA